MTRLGFRGKIWELIKNYLSDRKQYVKIGEHESELVAIRAGVPQGSNLGPLLFVIMLSDIQYLNLNATLIEFADDILLLWTDPVIDIAEKIESDLEKINNYYKNNGLTINSSKCKFMTLGKLDTSHAEEKLIYYGYEKVQELKYLGIIIDDKLNMKAQHQRVVIKLTNALRVISIIRNFLPGSSVWQFYNAFLLSHLNYCSFMLIRLPIKEIKRLQSIQNRGIKLIHRLDPQFPTVELFKRYAPNTLPVVGIIYLSILTLVRKALNNPSEAFNIYDMMSGERRKNLISFKRFRTNYVMKDVTYIGPKIYNQLPDEIRNTTELNLFKRKVKNYLIEKIHVLLDDSCLLLNKIV
ncbi:hypothetical protein PVAND_004211 [Polypedilum vanderplanki]|uniref:Reverse transcriptase domain-containing protein n=1 Tax=Polypedilum vanderplanki TaxID=319348 RepID=A0A9J6BWF2_POLVA|nr:hypothetical protein PVAND_004211 [Polypedilum vanderplanki]